MRKHILDHKSIRDDWDFMVANELNFHVTVLRSGGFSNRKTINGNSVQTKGKRKPLDQKHLRGAAYAVRVYPRTIGVSA